MQTFSGKIAGTKRIATRQIIRKNMSSTLYVIIVFHVSSFIES